MPRGRTWQTKITTYQVPEETHEKLDLLRRALSREREYAVPRWELLDFLADFYIWVDGGGDPDTFSDRPDSR